MQETCIGSLGHGFKLLAQIHQGSTPSGPRSFTPMIPLLRGLLAPATELASGAYLPAPDLTQPGSGRALDVVLAEEAAAALAAAGSSAFLHYVLGTSLHLLLDRCSLLASTATNGSSAARRLADSLSGVHRLCDWAEQRRTLEVTCACVGLRDLVLRRSERCAVNVLRLLTELFRQPTLRQSEAQIQLLLPPLLGPLQEALSPTVGWVLLPNAEQPQKHRSAQRAARAPMDSFQAQLGPATAQWRPSRQTAPVNKHSVRAGGSKEHCDAGP